MAVQQEEEERILAAALLIIGRPATARELSEVCTKLGTKAPIQIGTVCRTPNSPLCFIGNGLITFSCNALHFFSTVIAGFAIGLQESPDAVSLACGLDPSKFNPRKLWTSPINIHRASVTVSDHRQQLQLKRKRDEISSGTLLEENGSDGRSRKHLCSSSPPRWSPENAIVPYGSQWNITRQEQVCTPMDNEPVDVVMADVLPQGGCGNQCSSDHQDIAQEEQEQNGVNVEAQGEPVPSYFGKAENERIDGNGGEHAHCAEKLLEEANVPDIPQKGTSEIQKQKKKERHPQPELQKYQIEGEEGCGAFSVVYKARRVKDNRLVAIKCPLQGVSKEHFSKEIQFLKALGGKHGIIGMEEVIEDSDRLYIVLEYIEHDSFQTLKKEITLSELRWYGFLLFKALNYLHQKRIMHRDVKPGNFLFSRSKNSGYLVDFNLATELYVRPRNKENIPVMPLARSERTFIEEREALLERKSNRLEDSFFDERQPFNQKRREPMPKVGRKELLECVAKTMGPTPRPSLNRKRISASRGKLEGSPRRVPIQKPKSGPEQVQVVQPTGACVGTKGYSAPEVLLRLRHTLKLDIWSAGVTLLHLATAKLPFTSGGIPQTIKEISTLRGKDEISRLIANSGRPQPLLEDLLKEVAGDGMSLCEWVNSRVKTPTNQERINKLPLSFYDLMERCLQVDPAKRTSAREALEHEFFSPCLRARKVPEPANGK